MSLNCPQLFPSSHLKSSRSQLHRLAMPVANAGQCCYFQASPNNPAFLCCLCFTANHSGCVSSDKYSTKTPIPTPTARARREQAQQLNQNLLPINRTSAARKTSEPVLQLSRIEERRPIPRRAVSLGLSATSSPDRPRHESLTGRRMTSDDSEPSAGHCSLRFLDSHARSPRLECGSAAIGRFNQRCVQN